MAEYDIYSNTTYKWTQADSAEIASAGVPKVTMREYENHTDLMFQNLMFLRKSSIDTGSISNNSFSDLYKGTYQIVPTGNSYTLPYLGKHPIHMETAYKQIDIDADSNSWGLSIEQIRKNMRKWRPEIRTEWDSLNMSLFDWSSGKTASQWFNEKYTSFTGEGAQYRVGSSLSQQSPKVYDSSNTGQFSTTFTLINETAEFANSHYNFIMRMMLSLAPSYPDPMRVHVPYVYDVNIPSLTHLPLAFVSSFNAEPVGSAKMVKTLYVPEGWKITVSFNSLFPISRQLISTMSTSDQTLTENAFKLNTDDKPFENGGAGASEILSDIVSTYKATSDEAEE